MTQLTIYPDDQPEAPLLNTSEFSEIHSELSILGVSIERWVAGQALEPDADSDSILAAYQAEIDRLVAAGGYKTWDVISMKPDNPEKESLREKFLSEHTHSEDEIRFFVDGQGLFVLHISDQVFSLLCEKDELISVPAGTKHWFDMGPNPLFTAIRLFNNPEGWVADYTGDDIADRFPRLEN